MKDKIINEITAKMCELTEISRFLYDNPEIGGEEYKATQLLTDAMSQYGFGIDKCIYGLNTAFRGTYKSRKEGATVVFLCEYDALPEVGHGCGHNLIAAMALGAAIGLKSVLDEIGGEIVVLGTPAEETNGAKVMMTKKGAFDGATVAIMVHPNGISEESGSSLAMNALQFQFTGKAAHAAVSPETGINALDAVVLLFNSINAMRQHITSDVKIHGVISNGGNVPNIVPDFAEARFYIRAAEKSKLNEITEKVKACAYGAEKMTGAKVHISNFEDSYDNLRTNPTLSNIFNHNLKALGEGEIAPPTTNRGSLDIGNVSQVVPTIHPWIGIGHGNLGIHTKEFAACTMTEEGRNAIFKGACAMAMTGFDVITSAETRSEIKKDFNAL